MLGNGPHFKWTLGNDSKVEGEDTIWSQLMVVTASHYEAVRCAGLKKAAMIILIQRMRLARLGECLRPKTLPSAQCSSFNGKIPTINSRVVITSKKANITSTWTKTGHRNCQSSGSNCIRYYKKSHTMLKLHLTSF